MVALLTLDIGKRIRKNAQCSVEARQINVILMHMKELFRIASIVVALNVVGVCRDLHAQQYIRLPKTVEAILRANPNIWVFHVDDARIPRPKEKESGKEYQKRLDSFLETQRKDSKLLTDDQKQRLILILLNPQNYWQGGFTVGQVTLLGMDVKTKNDCATFICGDSMLCTYHNDKEETALLNDAGSRVFKQWWDNLTPSDQYPK